MAKLTNEQLEEIVEYCEINSIEEAVSMAREILQLRQVVEVQERIIEDAKGVIMCTDRHLWNTYRDDYLSHQGRNNPECRIELAQAKVAAIRKEG